MKNLAGDTNCDVEIEKELSRCKIEIVRNRAIIGEVPSSLRGKLGQFTFFRAWRYWVVEGNVPIEMARELYADPVGKTDIRVEGHSECPAPKDSWITWLGFNGRELLPVKELDDAIARFGENSYIVQGMRNKFRFVGDPKSLGTPVIACYHIDSEVGLRIFADTLRKYGLV